MKSIEEDLEIYAIAMSKEMIDDETEEFIIEEDNCPMLHEDGSLEGASVCDEHFDLRLEMP